MPSFPIVDSHVHLADPRVMPYPVFARDPRLDRPHLLDGFDRATEGCAVAAMVFAECEAAHDRSLDEVAWVAGLARRDARIRGIVARLAVGGGDAIAADLDVHRAEPLVKGVRRILQWEREPGFCLRDGFVRGVRMLGERGLSFDVTVRADQLGDACELVRRCPGTRFVLDHVGNPGPQLDRNVAWAEHLRAFASLDDTWCKVSGLVSQVGDDGWRAEGFRGCVDHVLDCFGPGRVLFGGDWPVLEHRGSYRRWVEALDGITAQRPEPERRALWHDNALRCYRL